MKFNATFFAVALCAANGFAVPDTETPDIYAKPDFATYEPILTRMPFGAIPDPSSSPVSPTADKLKEDAAKANLARQINMSAIAIMMDGRAAIGFTDLSAKPPANHFLPVGETEDGWTVVEADCDEDTAVIEKDGITITLQLGKGLTETAAPAGPGGRMGPAGAAGSAVSAAMQLNTGAPLGAGVSPPMPGDRELPPGLRRETRPPFPGGPGMGRIGGPPGAAVTPPAGSYSERLAQRNENAQLSKEAENRKQQETLEKLAKAAADEAIRKREEEAAEEREAAGGDPLDAPITEGVQ